MDVQIYFLLCVFSYWIYHNYLTLLRFPILKQLVPFISLHVLQALENPKTHPSYSVFGLLILGKVPQKNSIEHLLKKGDLVVSMLEDHEIHTPVLSTHKIIPSEFWKNHGIHYHRCPMQDLSTQIDITRAHDTISMMHYFFSQGKRIYLHCLWGKGRSFIVAMCYFGIYGLPYINENGEVQHKAFNSYESALCCMKKIRPQVTATEAHRNTIVYVVTSYSMQNKAQVHNSAFNSAVSETSYSDRSDCSLWNANHEQQVFN